MDSSVVARRDLDLVTKWALAEEDSEHFVAYFKGDPVNMENWFLGCSRGCLIIRQWHECYLKYWKSLATKLQHTVYMYEQQKFNMDIRDLRFFADVKMSHHRDSQGAVSGYVAQQVCFNKLMQESREFAAMFKQNFAKSNRS